mgnify:CR=1 FL=1
MRTDPLAQKERGHQCGHQRRGEELLEHGRRDQTYGEIANVKFTRLAILRSSR